MSRINLANCRMFPFEPDENYDLMRPRNPTPCGFGGKNVMPAFSNAATILANASSRASDRHCSVEATRGSPLLAATAL